MKTLVLNEPGHFSLTESAPPAAPAAGEAQIAIHRVGICGTDLHAYAGRQPFFAYPRILGHELGAEIVALGPDANPQGLAVGDRVCVRPYLNCGVCGACRRGTTNCCSKLQVLGVHTDGGMRERINVPIDKLHRANDLSFDQLAIVEMLCIGSHAARRAEVVPGEFALVIGAGPIGLGATQFAALDGARVIAMDVADSRLEQASEQPGIEFVIDGRGDVAAQLHAITGADDLPTLVFDATGNPRSMQNSFNLVAQGGRLIFVGLVQGEISFNDPEFHRRELTLKSSRNATAQDFDRVLAALAEKTIHVAPWITHHASPEEMLGQFDSWTRPETGVVKAMLDF
ncbi:MAG: zinc-binding alcohol dehydrogenase family protein [Caldilineaceae bacterium]|nr:zinc-binding alcohol dehydrogenase family protein [Caldilineaceae bacterium]HRJ44866.1 zinc-binding alcohol dehydrogenase family protein [Caldilineaceae bacterium]